MESDQVSHVEAIYVDEDDSDRTDNDENDLDDKSIDQNKPKEGGDDNSPDVMNTLLNKSSGNAATNKKENSEGELDILPETDKNAPDNNTTSKCENIIKSLKNSWRRPEIYKPTICILFMVAICLVCVIVSSKYHVHIPNAFSKTFGSNLSKSKREGNLIKFREFTIEEFSFKIISNALEK